MSNNLNTFVFYFILSIEVEIFFFVILFFLI